MAPRFDSDALAEREDYYYITEQVISDHGALTDARAEFAADEDVRRLARTVDALLERVATLEREIKADRVRAATVATWR